MTSITEPSKLVGVTKTILGYTLMSRILGSPITAAKISNLGPPGTEKFISGMRNILAEVLNDLAVTPAMMGPIEDVKEGITIDFAPSSVTPGKQSIIDKVIESETEAFPGSEQDLMNLEKEREQFFLLQKKWGKDIIRRDKKSSRSFDFNPIMRIPVKSI